MTIWRLITLISMCSWISVSAAGAEVAAQHQPDKFYVIYDSSNSMWGALSDESRKYESGRKALSAFLSQDFEGRQIAFRAYGHREKTDCRDSELIVPFTDSTNAKDKISDAVARIRPTGKTPISFSLQEALKDFGESSGDILLVSDGIETCESDPCDLVRAWQASNVNIRVHVVGVGLSDYQREAMACIADASGGKYFDADSEERFAEALIGAGSAIAAPKPKPEEVETAQGYELRIVANDESGRSYVVAGTLSQEGSESVEVRSHRRNVLKGPGDYTIQVGPVLADNTTYEPVTKKFRVEEPGATTVEVTVQAPAIVSAQFLEEGAEHPGALVTAFVNDVEAFRFRAFDEALARPGAYEFRTEPNKDNELTQAGTLVAGEHTELLFELTKTINFFIVFRLPNGEIIRRNSTLMRGGETVYQVHGQNGGWARPGTYEVSSPDPMLPLPPTTVDIRNDGGTITLPLDAGFVEVSYAPSDDSYLSTADRAFIEPVDRNGSRSFIRPGDEIALTPGAYDVIPQEAAGYFEPQQITVENGQTHAVLFEPKPLGRVIITYAPSDQYKTDPDRAFVEALDGQDLKKGFVRPGAPLKLLPGRYKVNGWRAAGTIPAQEFTVTPHETVNVVLRPTVP